MGRVPQYVIIIHRLFLGVFQLSYISKTLWAQSIAGDNRISFYISVQVILRIDLEKGGSLPYKVRKLG
jgi:hypothetical protein